MKRDNTNIYQKNSSRNGMRIVNGSKQKRRDPKRNTKNLVFSVAANEWLKEVSERVKESTRSKYINIINNHLIPEFKDTLIEQITYAQVDKFCKRLLRQGKKDGSGLSSKTVQDIYSVLKCVFRFADRKGHRISFDARSIEIKVEPKTIHVFSTREQSTLTQYILKNRTELSIGILLSLYTGIRIGELCALRWKDICLEEAYIDINSTIQRIQTHDNGDKKTKIIHTSPKTVSSVRQVPIIEPLLIILKEMKKDDDCYFLTGRSDVAADPRTIQNRYKKLLKNAGVQYIKFHGLRHTFATYCVEMEFDIKTLSTILGHSSVTVTLNRYVHPTMNQKRKHMQKLTPLLIGNTVAYS